MLISNKFFIGFVLLISLVVPRFAFGATGPIAGIYSVATYVVSASATNGGSCGAPQGYYLSSYFLSRTGENGRGGAPFH